MSTNVSSVTSHFPSPQNGFTTTTSGSVSSGATTVGLNSVAGYTNGQTVVFVIDPTDASKKQTFTGIMDTSGSQVTGVKWTAGTNQTHALGATVVDYATATHIAMMTKGISVHANQDGSLITQAVRDALNLDSGTSTGWTVLGYTLNTVTYNGNRSYDLVFNGNDLTSEVSAGMRLRTTRTSAAPTQCTSLNGTTQYYSKSSPNKLTFTDDFVVSAWVKLSSYPSSDAGIASRSNAGSDGWWLGINSAGQLLLNGTNGAAANYRRVVAYQSLPLNKWVHVAAQLDMNTGGVSTTTSYTMIDGVDVPAAISTGGTAPTTLVNAGTVNIGAINAANFFPGKIAQVAIYNAKVTQATIKASISQGLSGSETSLASAYSFNNAITDLNTSTPNDLTANGSAVATNADSPFGTQASGSISSTIDYAIIQKASFSTNTTLTVQVPEGCTIPTSGGVSAVSYSTQKVPYGFPAQRAKWQVLTVIGTSETVNIGATNTWTQSHAQITVPIGSWNIGYRANLQLHSTVAGGRNGAASLYNATYNALTASGYNFPLTSQIPYTNSTADGLGITSNEYGFDIATAATFVMAVSIFSASGTETYIVSGQVVQSHIYADNAYL